MVIKIDQDLLILVLIVLFVLFAHPDGVALALVALALRRAKPFENR